MDSRNSGFILPPAAGTPADALFNVAGLNLSNIAYLSAMRLEEAPEPSSAAILGVVAFALRLRRRRRAIAR